MIMSGCWQVDQGHWGPAPVPARPHYPVHQDHAWNWSADAGDIQSSGGHHDHYWPLLTIINHFSQLLTTFAYYWPTLTTIKHLILATFDLFWALLTSTPDHCTAPGVAPWGGGPAEGHEPPLRRPGDQPGHVHWPALLPARHPRLQIQNTGELQETRKSVLGYFCLIKWAWETERDRFWERELDGVLRQITGRDERVLRKQFEDWEHEKAEVLDGYWYSLSS